MADSFILSQAKIGKKQYLAVNCRHYVSNQATSKPASYPLYTLSGNLDLSTLRGSKSPAGFVPTTLEDNRTLSFDTPNTLLYVPSDYAVLVEYTNTYRDKVGAEDGYFNYAMEPIQYGVNYWHSAAVMPGYGVNKGKFNDAQCEALMQTTPQYNTQCPLWVNVQSFAATLAPVSSDVMTLTLNIYMKRWVKPSSGHPYNLFNFCVLIPLK